MINDHATVTDGVTRKAVRSASYRDEEVMRPRETYRGPDVCYAGATRNQRRVSVDRSVPYTSVLLVARVCNAGVRTRSNHWHRYPHRCGRPDAGGRPRLDHAQVWAHD